METKEELKKKIAYYEEQIRIIEKNTKELIEAHKKWKKQFQIEQKKEIVRSLLPILDIWGMYEKHKEHDGSFDAAKSAIIQIAEDFKSKWN